MIGRTGLTGLVEALEAAELVVVGSGLFGLTVAERAVSTTGARVVVLERRSHIGGNAHSSFDEATGIEVHRYGTHVFHTSSSRVWEYVNRFTSFNDYRHHVFTTHAGRVYPMPINLSTMSTFFGRVLSPAEAHSLLRSQGQAESVPASSNLEDKAISLVGRPLYEAFIREYTIKQWRSDPTELPASIISRLPVRYTFESRYFTDTWEGLPSAGYGAWLDAMADDPRIEVRLGVDFHDVRHLIKDSQLVVYTGPLDRYFDYSEGILNWLTLNLELRTLEVPDFQGTSVMNFADVSAPHTRIHEFRHLHPERDYHPSKTVIMLESSKRATGTDEPFYPVGTEEDRAVVARYRELAKSHRNVVFGGRLGSYRYMDMHVAIASALTTFEETIVGWLAARRGGNA